MENFFGKMKNEMFYGHEYEFKTLGELESAMEEYIHYYNKERIHDKIKRPNSLPGKESSLIMSVN